MQTVITVHACAALRFVVISWPALFWFSVSAYTGNVTLCIEHVWRAPACRGAGRYSTQLAAGSFN